MIYTVTFNPSLDYIVSVNNFQLGMTNRTATEMMLPGGKGINVSIVLKNLGLENTALGFVAGFTGDEIQRQVEEIGVNARFIPVDEGISRINLKLQNIEGTRSTDRDRRSAGKRHSSYLKCWISCRKTMCWCWQEAFRHRCRMTFTEIS